MSEDVVVLDGVREYGEEDTVELRVDGRGRLCVVAINEGGYNSTWVDLLDLIAWLRAHRPDLLEAQE